MTEIEDRDAALLAYWGRRPTVDEAREHLAHHEGAPFLVPLKKPCRDCAVTCGLYTPYAATLSLLPPDEIGTHSRQWFCHNNGQRACAGNIEYQARICAALKS